MGRGRSIGIAICLSFCVGGCILFLLMWESRYYEFWDLARWPLLICPTLGILLAIVLPKGRHPWIRLALTGAFAAFLVFVVLPKLAVSRHKPSPGLGRYNLGQLGMAMSAYQLEYSGYLPFDERGPLHSLSLLYPAYLDAPAVFQNPFISSSWKRRKNGMKFPDDTGLDGAVCHFGYTWHAPRNAPDDFALVADMAQFLMLDDGEWGVNVLYPDGRVRWQEEPYASSDSHDNIFAPEKGWSPDTDSWIRQE